MTVPENAVVSYYVMTDDGLRVRSTILLYFLSISSLFCTKYSARTAL